jgi:hypothetical protein
MTGSQDSHNAPSGAADAVLKPSDPVPEDAVPVRGVEFDHFAGRSITVDELLDGYTNMGFQASSVGEAVRIINDMVRVPHTSHDAFLRSDIPLASFSTSAPQPLMMLSTC